GGQDPRRHVLVPGRAVRERLPSRRDSRCLQRAADRPRRDYGGRHRCRGLIPGVVTLPCARAPIGARSFSGVILAGTLVYLVTLYAGFWSTYAYFAAIGPILAWRIDGWLGVPQPPLVPAPRD